MKGEKDDFSGKKIAENIRQLLSASGNEKIPAQEKEVLWQRIDQSLSRKTGRIRRLTWLKTIAAAVIVLAAAAVWFSGALESGEWSPGAWLSGNAQEHPTAMKQMEEVAILADTLESLEIQLVTTENKTSSNDAAQPVYNTVIVPYGKRMRLTLPDSSSVWLNSGSKLVYPLAFSPRQREVYLEGEAYFTVQHHNDKPFYVHTHNMEIKVLGTEFNVSAYDDDKRSHVMLVNGSIELTTGRGALPGKIKTRLVPHEVAVYDSAVDDLEISNMQVEEYVSWRTGYMTFRNTTLETILKKLERYYRVDIELQEPGLGQETFTGPLDLKKDIQEVMNIICMTTSLVYEQQEGRLLLKKNK